ncbi:ABC transporter ATP-binding protein [Fusobacterium perfoetens]|uniref:ABC transporter ATP-binding protein n=1 Tax=Fusobacterium perfoetens TaxID=852 RepID=UPI001F2671DD|nr:ABC transporter ATP-binding protein [Fusobacterium perfoetens]MCF2612230.1 ABC transporter ATP-binding protein [Fusobacterium perfoetens]
MFKDKIAKIYSSDALGGFVKYSFKYKKWLFGTLLLSVISSAMGAVPAWLSKYLVDDVLISKNGKMMVVVGGGIFLTTMIKALSAYYAETTSVYLSEKIRREVKIDIFKHLEHLPMSFFTQNKLGDIMARLSGDSSSLGRIGFLLFDMVREIIAVSAFLIRMFQLDITLSFIALIVAPAIFGMVKKYTRKMKRSGKERQDTIGEATAFMQESLAGIQVIKGFNKIDKIIENYEDVTETEMQKIYRAAKIKAKISPINEILTALMLVMIAAYGGYAIIYLKDFTPGDLISFLTAAGLMQQPLKRFIRRNSELYEIIPSGDRVMEIFKIKPEVDCFIEEPKKFSGEVNSIEFKNVGFTYPNSETKVLKDVSFSVKKGEVVAFVGSSGSGKTTIVNLLPRFYDIEEGNIEINGIDVREYSLKQYRQYIGMVPQDTFLFSGTIADNIGFGKEGVSFEEIVEASKMANAYNFIKDLEKGFDTEVGERGVLLSGGQKQRIAIARALIQNPAIMILDEATSALDTESEKLVQEALDKLMVGRTTFVIAHRLSTIISADKIVVMEKGEVKEIGKHEELLAKNGLYAKLYNIQYNKSEN